MSKQTSLVISPQQAISQSTDLRSLVNDWYAHLDRLVGTNELSDASRRTYRLGMQQFLSWCSGGQISPDVIRDWIADIKGAGLKPGTVNTWLGGVRSFFAWAYAQRLVPYNPTNGVKGAKRQNARSHKRDSLTDAEIRRLLAMPGDDRAGIRDRAIINLMIYTAARTVEIHRANLSDIATESGHAVLRVQGKGHEETDDKLVVFNPQAESALYDWLAVRGNKPGPLFTSLSPRSKGEQLSLSHIRHAIKKYLKAAGIDHYRKTTHSLRHTAISKALQNGAPIQKVQAMARHARIDTTMIYVHETDRATNPAEQFIDYGEHDHGNKS